MFFRPEKEKFEDMTKDELVKKIEELHNEIGSSKFGKTDHKWFSLIEHAPNMVVVIDRDHKIQFINHTIPGYDKEEVIGTEVYRHIAPAYHGVAESIINHVFKTGEVSSYENEGAGPYDEHAWYEAQVGPVKSGDEIVAVTLFITDITLRKSVEEALVRSEEQYRMLVEGANQPIFKVRKDGEFLFLNTNAASQLGGKPENYIGKTMWNVFPKEIADSQMNDIRNVIDSGEKMVIKEAESIVQGEKRWFEVSIQPLENSHGELDSALLIVTDIGERRKADVEIRREKDFTSKVINALEYPLYVIDVDYKVALSNKAAKNKGIAEGGLCYEMTHHKNVPCEDCECPLKKVIEEKKSVQVEHGHYGQDGKNTTVEVHADPVFDDNGNVVQMIEYAIDITERKKTQDELRKLSHTVKQSPNIVMMTNDKGIIEYVNPKFYEITGFDPEEVIGRIPGDLGERSEEQADKERQIWDTISANKEWHGLLRNLKKSGEAYWESASIFPLKDQDGNITNYVKISEDYTEKKKTEEELAGKTRLLNNIISNIPFFVFWKDRNSVYVGCNDIFAKVAGIKHPSDIVGKTDYDLAWKREEADFFRQIDREVMEKGKPILDIEEPQLQAGGKEAILLTSKVPLRDSEGNISGILGIYTDITERKQTEEALKESEERFRNMFENAVDGMLLADVETHRFVNANNKLCKMIGYSLDEIKNLGIEDIHPKEDLSYVFDKFEKQIKGETTLAENLPVLRKDGSIFYADINGSIISLKGKTYLLGAFRDITGRREMEEKLRESEARYRTIFENSGSPMALVKNDLSILMMNDEFAKLSGYSQEDLKSKDVLQFIHTEDLEKVKEYHRLRNIDPSSVPDRYELRMVDKDGQTKEGYIMVAAVPDTDIMVIAFADVTEIKRSEQKLKEQKDLLDNINKALEHKVKEIQEAMGHIKRLEGLVPICASCKKIKVEEKDAEGKDKWVQLETYISQKTDASLTHGLCPDCIKKLYGNKLGKEKRDSDA